MTTHIQPLNSGEAGPPARPAAPVPSTASAQVTAQRSPIGETNTSPDLQEKISSQTTAGPGARRVGKRRRELLQSRLLDRDRAILGSLEQHRFLTSHQITQFHFTDHTQAASAARAARRTLARLEHDQLVSALDGRRIGGLPGGSQISTWYLTGAGYRVLHDTSDRYRMHEPTTRFLRHTLAIADTHLSILGAAAHLNGRAGISIEREAVRRFPDSGGGTQLLTPDLAATIQARDESGSFEDHWFIEVDLGTESLPTLIRKCAQYEAYRRSGLEQANRDGTFPLVLWVFHGEKADRRIQALTQHLNRSGELDPQLFRFATTESLHRVLTSGGAI